MSKKTSLFKASLTSFKKTYKYTAAYELFYRICIPALLFPFASSLFHNITVLWTESSLHDKSLSSLFLNPLGLGFAALIILTSTLFSLMAIVSHLSVADDIVRKGSMGATMPLIIKQLKKLTKPGAGLVVVLMMFIFPIVQLNIGTMILPSTKVPLYVYAYLLNNTVTITFTICAALLFYYILSTYVFTFHYMVLDDLEAAEALKASRTLTKKFRLKISFLLVFYQTIIFLFSTLSFLVSYSLSYLVGLLSIQNSFFVLAASITIFLITTLFALWMLSLIYPFALAMVTTMFYRLKKTTPIVEEEETSIMPTRLIIFQRVFTLFVIAASLSMSVTSTMTSLSFKTDANTTTIMTMSATTPDPNTRTGLEFALKNKISAVSVTLYMTKDGALVLNSSPNMMIKDVDTPISEILYKDFLSLAEHGQPVVTFEEAVIISGTRLHLFVEFGAMPKTTTPAIIKKQREMIQKSVYITQIHHLQHTVSMMSSSVYEIAEVKLLNPDIKVGLITSSNYFLPGLVDADFYVLDFSDLTNRFISQSHLHARKIYVRNIHSTQDALQAKAMGVDGIFTYFEASRIEAIKK